MNGLALVWLVALPAIGAALLLLAPRGEGRLAKAIALAASGAATLVAWGLALTTGPGSAGLTHQFSAPWVPSLGVDFLLGIDGVSLPLVVLTASLSLAAVVASLGPVRHPRGYFALLLLLETGMLGVFLALDFVLFYVFWELILVPMYLLVAIWGGEGRSRAALKYFVFTLAGSVLMLGGGLLLYGASDLTRLSADDLVATAVVPSAGTADTREALADWLAGDNHTAARFIDAEAAGTPLRTFNLLALGRLGRSTDCFTRPEWLGRSLAWWAFPLLVTGLAVKLPAVPLHTWLPDTHTEAPTPVSMLLAGVMLKLGGYGLVRIAWAACPSAAIDFAPLVAVVGVVGMFWGALAALGQNDFKRLVAYSSVSHMGYVLLGLAAGTVGGSTWTVGATGAVFQMVAHGVTSAGLFLAVGIIYDRVHHRDLDRLGGLMNRMPLASGTALVLALASLGLPGLCGFVGELLVLVAAWGYWPAIAIAAAAVTVPTAAYTLRAVRLAYYGAELRGPHGESLTPLAPREALLLATLVAATVVLGVFPGLVTRRVEPPLAAWGDAFDLPSPRVTLAPPEDVHDAPRTTR